MCCLYLADHIRTKRIVWECIFAENKSITVTVEYVDDLRNPCTNGHQKLNRAPGMHALTTIIIQMEDGRVVVIWKRQARIHPERA